MTLNLDDYPPAGQEIEAVDVTQLLEVVRKLTNWSILGTAAATLSTAATTFTALGGTSSISYTKLGGASETNILAFLLVQAFKTTAVVNSEWAVSDGTNTRLATTFNFNTVSEHMDMGLGVATMTSLAAGTYTLQIMGRNQSAVAGLLTVNANDNVSLFAMEVGV